MLRPGPLALLLLPLLGSGCVKNLPLPDLEALKPTLSFQSFKVRDASFRKLDTTFLFQVDNPLPVKVDIASIRWDLDVSGHDFLDGDRGLSLKLDAKSKSPVRVPVSISFADLYNVVRESRGKDELPWRLTGSVTVDTPAGPLSLPFDQTGTLPVLHPPAVSFRSLKVGKVDLTRQTARLDLVLALENRGKSPLTFDAFDYTIALGGSNVATGAARITPVSSVSEIELPIELKLLQVGKEIVDAVTGKSPLKVGLAADAVVASPVGPIPLKLNETARLTPR